MTFKINNTDVSKVQVYGGNIISFSNSLNWDNNGITYISQASGAIIINGTATAESYCNLALTEPYPQGILNGVYTLSGCPDKDGLSLVLANRSGGAIVKDSANKSVINSNNVPFTGQVETSGFIPVVSIRVAAGTSLDNLEIKPMFNIGDKVLPFKPYFEKQVNKLIIKKNGTETVVYNNI